ncbi:hypothetical protein MNEG_0130, partial [Monoraphidium neglectum]
RCAARGRLAHGLCRRRRCGGGRPSGCAARPLGRGTAAWAQRAAAAAAAATAPVPPVGRRRQLGRGCHGGGGGGPGRRQLGGRAGREPAGRAAARAAAKARRGKRVCGSRERGPV